MAEGGENITAVEEVETNGTAPNGVADDASDEVFQELMDAVQLGDIPAVKKLLKKCKSCINRQDVFGDTPLHYAAARGSVPLLNALLGAGASPTVGNATGSTALHKAAIQGDVQAIRVLLKHGADPLQQNGAGMLAEAITRNPRARTTLLGDAATSMQVDIPKSMHRLVIGPKGENLRELEQDTKCWFDIPKPKSESNTITITGRGDAPRAAKELLEETYCSKTKKAVMKWGDEELEALPVSMRTHVSKDRHGRVNGKGGKKRREIEEEFGVRIIIPSVADEDDVIRIEGKDNDSVDQALRQVLAAASARDPSQRNGQQKKKSGVVKVNNFMHNQKGDTGAGRGGGRGGAGGARGRRGGGRSKGGRGRGGKDGNKASSEKVPGGERVDAASGAEAAVPRKEEGNVDE